MFWCSDEKNYMVPICLLTTLHGFLFPFKESKSQLKTTMFSEWLSADELAEAARNSWPEVELADLSSQLAPKHGWHQLTLFVANTWLTWDPGEKDAKHGTGRIHLSWREDEGEVSLLPPVDGGWEAEWPSERLPQDRFPRRTTWNFLLLHTDREAWIVSKAPGEEGEAQGGEAKA